MYVLGQSAAHGWLTLPCGVAIDFAPIDRPMVRAARRAVRKFVADHADMAVEDLADETADIFSATLIRQGIKGWRGLGNAAGKLVGKPTPDLIEAFLADTVLFDQADAAYVIPWAQASREKNASSPSRNGISTGATQAKIIAGSAAPAKPRAAKPAPTGRKNPRPTRAKASGRPSAALADKSA